MHGSSAFVDCSLGVSVDQSPRGARSAQGAFADKLEDGHNHALYTMVLCPV